ncbi:hypothetical protein KDW72_gp45 [Mycobacterium phage Grizzly]|uniref:Uncharacterized protein n=2 Tax=Liefievirus TaxID=1623288 RepID=A0A386KGH3_9CAUD|nr:hypothetical protein KDW71_gp47 [Mycobacterium phage Rabbs]YP_010051455.1 hypothetical protein KDW72_gp45 [Mycobacterium phage Grizzly]UUG69228.1 DNA binding protein [Mycobacterium phage Barkley26]WDE67691.1 DNA directed RNA polymerase subunit [Mycobacterium phage RitVan]AYD84009.1 hypothetical protein SEA_GRIZZLY_45 [Mycobacterium phage Grizzly]QBI96819.1 hypothetical protein SEA_RABBS_47 [Mycobacterium phage Rabbs]
MFAGSAEHWIAECEKCHKMFRDSPETDGVCPHCGHENTFPDA